MFNFFYHFLNPGCHLISQMQLLYLQYKLTAVYIATGSKGAIPNNLELNLRKLNITEDRLAIVRHRIRNASILGTIEIIQS